ncbi:MAG: hypothetical protein LBT59_13520 [Clostridiales bacterium]|jgi:hypothetical protein|nr:hypothetical protein [Clostridiales bacterium]
MDKYQEALTQWASFNVSTKEDRDLRFEKFKALFAYNSGKLENDEITWANTQEIFETGRVLNFSGDLKALIETRNQKMCFEILRNAIALKVPISLNLIKEVHYFLTNGTYDERLYIQTNERPGEFKTFCYNEAEGSNPDSVEADLLDLLEELSECEGKDALRFFRKFTEAK